MRQELKHIEDQIKIAAGVDKALPPVFRMRYKSPLGFLSPDLEVIQERILYEEIREVVTDDDYAIWVTVCLKWLPELEPKIQKIVWWRCCGMGWRHMGWLLKKRRYAQRELSRWTLKSQYYQGLERIYKKVS